MIVEAQVTINGSKEAIWAAITNIENGVETINGIEKIEIIEKPPNGLVGIKWRETRILRGDPATVEKWITEAVDNQFYQTKAQSNGFMFLTTKRISENRGGNTLTEIHEFKPQSITAKLMSIPMFLFKGMIKKVALQDLNDIKTAVERERKAESEVETLEC